MKYKYLTILILFHIFFFELSNGQGYYKDIFMDGGIKLTSMERLPAAELLNLSIENFASTRYSSTYPPTYEDTINQNNLIIGSRNDINGILLYPDGQPRFRVVYVNGGIATSHGESLGEKGRQRYRAYISAGGSYVGTCAGAFLTAAGTIKADTVYPRDNYFGIWPGIARATRLLKSSTGMFIEKNSPLLQYYDFGGDLYIDSIRHNGGCHAYEEELYPDQTEILLRYDHPAQEGKRDIYKKISAWAYKENEYSGRVIAIGSHPEAIAYGERLELMAALIKYAIDGNGKTRLKDTLENGEIRKMYKSTYDNDPDFTMIGDKQYHHFMVEIPRNAKNISIEVKGALDYDLFLYLKKDDFAFRSNYNFLNLRPGAEKSLFFEDLEPGTWYLSVECNSTVEAIKTEWGYKYLGETSVLNGVPYSILVKWE